MRGTTQLWQSTVCTAAREWFVDVRESTAFLGTTWSRVWRCSGEPLPSRHRAERRVLLPGRHCARSPQHGPDRHRLPPPASLGPPPFPHQHLGNPDVAHALVPKLLRSDKGHPLNVISHEPAVHDRPTERAWFHGRPCVRSSLSASVVR